MPFLRAEPGKTKIGWIGTGVMGRPMCQHLMARGYSLTVFNRHKEKAEALLSAGAAWAQCPRDVAAASDVVCAMVGFPSDVQQTFLGPGGALEGAKPGRVMIDFTTSDPALARAIAEEAKNRGVAAIDAPVSGGDVGARNAALSIMVGGDTEAVAAVQPILECLGKTIVHQGPAGAGQHTKMVNQILIATNMIGVCEALLYAHKAGLDPESVLRSVGGGAAASWSLANLAPRILRRDFEPGFFVDHFIKDMSIAVAESQRMGLVLPGLALAQQLYLSVRAHGYGRKGTQALMLALEQLSNVNSSKDAPESRHG